MERLLLVALNLLPGIGPQTVRKLIKTFGSLEAAIEERERLHRVVGRKKAEILRGVDLKLAQEEILKAEELGVGVLTLLDEGFPKKLKTFDYLPTVLYYRGDVGVLDGRSVAVVGTRYPSEDAKTFTEKLCHRLASAGFTVVSGGAYGIDTHAHVGALKGGKTAVVLGSGFGRIYPRGNLHLFERVVESGGVVLSEFPIDTPPLSGNFPARNRVIAALGDLLVVVQAPRKSGALITATWALDQGKDVWAVPFSPMERRAYGSNRLIYEGAKPLYDLEEFLLEIAGDVMPRPGYHEDDLDELEAHMVEILRQPMHIDEISYKTGISPTRLYPLLLSLQMRGYVQELPGKLYKATV